MFFSRKTKNRKCYYGTCCVSVIKRHADGFTTVELEDGTRRLVTDSELTYR